MEHLIPKYLQNDLTLDEQHEFSKWLESDLSNVETLRVIEAYWHHYKDTSAEKSEVRVRLHSKMESEKVLQNKKRISRKRDALYRIAASIVVIGSIVFGVFQYNYQSEPVVSGNVVKLIEKVSLPGQFITTQLPDGTIVKMNVNSKLLTPDKFEGKNREVTLIGEAFFDVKRDEAHPFIIKTEEIDIQVLGTSFNVRTYGDNPPEVAVKSGKVAVRHGEFNFVELEENQMVKLMETDLVKAEISEEYDPFAWTHRELVFGNESLNQVFTKISRWYGVTIEVTTPIERATKYTAHYTNPTIKEVMDVLAFVYDFKYKFNENDQKIIIQ